MSKDVQKQVHAIIKAHEELVTKFNDEAIDTIIYIVGSITKCLKNGGCVYTCGNGGSAADAQHIAGELVGSFEKKRKGLAAVALTTDSSVMTSVSNDYGYDNLFYKQVEALVNKGDILWAISTSGSSANIVSACELAKENGAVLLTFTGKKNSRLEDMADICLCAGSDSTARSQEVHQLAYHIICCLVEQNFC
ncbi:MAG: D-sedoheptulose-7-phosphate isomerase [Planctomycetota bacterium]|jgi:D-sedoheptulose 7-phosphate isomerase